jgi:hypothetical protein
MNVKLLRKIKKHILAYPKTFAMSFWQEPRRVSESRPCGTAACIGGWAKLLTKDRKLTAADALGLSHQGAWLLFNMHRWPSRFQTKAKEETAAFARNAAARIDHFIATDGRE